MPRSQELDKTVQQKERRQERRQEREERREKRKAERRQKKNSREHAETEESCHTSPISEISQVEEDSLSRESYHSSAIITSESSDSGTVLSNPDSALSTSSKERSDSVWGVVTLLSFIGFIAYSIIRWITSRRCPHCGKLWAMQEIDEKFLGHTKTERVKKDNQIYYVHYSRVQITRRCKYCEYMDYQNKVVKGDEA